MNLITLHFKKQIAESEKALLMGLGSYQVWIPKMYVCGDRMIQVHGDFSFQVRDGSGKPHSKFVGIELAEEFSSYVEEVE